MRRAVHAALLKRTGPGALLTGKSIRCPSSQGRLVGFDIRLDLELLGRQVTVDVGLLACRHLEETLGLMEMAQDMSRDGQVGGASIARLVAAVGAVPVRCLA